MIKNIVFDIGNVLVDFRWRDFLSDKGFDEAMIERIAKASVYSKYWDEFDKGIMSEEEVFEKFISLDPQIADILHKAFDNINGMVTKRDNAIPWIKALKDAGYKVYYLSNFSKKAYDECRDSLDFMAYTDGGIMSYTEYITKPDPEIYKRLLKRFDLNSSETVFVDDLKANVEAAVKEGINGIVYTSYESTILELKRIGVKGI